MNTGEDIQGLRKIVDFTRLISIFILAMHFYLSCRPAFLKWGLTADITDRLLTNIAKTGLFETLLMPKLFALILLVVSLVAIKGRKDEKIRVNAIVTYLVIGLLLYFGSALCLYLYGAPDMLALLYMGITSTGYLLMLTGGGQLTRLIKNSLSNDIFNSENETFPQEERLIENQYSINLPARYRLRNKVRESWINIINPFRGILVAGTPGAGKTYFVIRHIIDQHIRKGFSMFIYDFKFDDLSKIAYNKLLRYQGNYQVKPKFYAIDLENPKHRCNPLSPEGMDDITDAAEASRTIMLGLNRDWIKKQGDFFVESAVNFVTAVIWYLRKYKNGKFCTLPHLIELIQFDYDPLFAVLQKQEEIRPLISPFISALQRKAMPQLEGQIASAKIGLARLSSPQLYYVLSGNDFTLDLNNPKEPKIICVGNNPQKLQIYGAVLSLYISRVIKLVNRKGQLRSSLIFDEFPTIFFNNMDSLIATARSNKVSTTIAVQSTEQLKKDYGPEQADVITGIVGNIISGQVTGDTAKKLSEGFGKIVQDKESKSISSSDVSITKSTQMDYAIPASKIASLSAGEFVGIVADNPEEKIALKMFHSEIQNNHQSIAEEEADYIPIPEVKRVSSMEIKENYLSVKADIDALMKSELKKITSKPLKKQNNDRPEHEPNGESEAEQQGIVM